MYNGDDMSNASSCTEFVHHEILDISHLADISPVANLISGNADNLVGGLEGVNLDNPISREVDSGPLSFAVIVEDIEFVEMCQKI